MEVDFQSSILCTAFYTDLKEIFMEEISSLVIKAKTVIIRHLTGCIILHSKRCGLPA